MRGQRTVADLTGAAYVWNWNSQSTSDHGFHLSAARTAEDGVHRFIYGGRITDSPSFSASAAFSMVLRPTPSLVIAGIFWYLGLILTSQIAGIILTGFCSQRGVAQPG